MKQFKSSRPEVGGLTVPVPSARAGSLFAEVEITEEAVIGARPEDDFRVEPLVSEGDILAQGAPMLRSRRHPDIVVTAPMPGRVAALDLGPGHRLSALKLFHEKDAGRHRHDTSGEVRGVLLGSGMWRLIRSRPFGRVPLPGRGARRDLCRRAGHAAFGTRSARRPS